jgi:hypothetical protein
MATSRKRKDPHAAALGRKGARAKWRGVPKDQRSEMLRQVARARWHPQKKESSPP